MKFKIVFISFFTVLSVFGQVEHIRFNNLRSDHGLSQNSGRAIKQDKYGFIWIATESGVNKYDGREFIVYRHDPDNFNSLANNYINSLETGRTERVFIGTDGDGVNVLNLLTDSFTVISSATTDSIIKNDFIYSLYEDKSFNLWIGTGNGLYFYNFSNNSIKTVIEANASKRLIVRSISKLDDNNLISLTSNGIYVVDLKTATVSLQNNFIKNCALVLENKFVLLGGLNGINAYKLDRGKLALDSLETSKYSRFNGMRINDIVEDIKSKNIWVGSSDSGLFVINTSNNIIRNFKPDKRLPLTISSLNITNLFIDNSGILWIGTYFDGINYIDSRRKKFRPVVPEYNNNYILSITGIAEDKSNNIWMGSMIGLYKYDLEKNKVVYYKPGEKNSINEDESFITSVHVDKKGNVWFGSNYGGLSVYKNGNFINYKYDKNNPYSISGNSVWGISEDKNGNIWLATWGGGLSCFIVEENRFERFVNNPSDKNSLSNNNLNAVYCDKNGNVWVGTWNYGISVYNTKNNKWTRFVHDANHSESLSHNIVLSFHQDNDGVIWIGTFGGGLNRFNASDSSFTRYTMKNGLSENSIMGIRSDKRNNLWVFTIKGLSVINQLTGYIRNYDINDGLQSNEFSQNGFFYNDNGFILASGSGGFNYFYPDSIFDNFYEPNIYLKSLYINNILESSYNNKLFRKPLYLSDTLTLSYKQNNVALSFVALHYSNPSKIKYSCKLEGYDDDWVDLGSFPLVRYTSLAPRTYKFIYKATNADGKWMSSPKSLIIIVKPPFWMTWWFILLVALFFIVSIYLFIKLRERKLQKEKRVLEQRVRERTNEINLQKEEIAAQRDEIEAQRDLVVNQKNHIEAIHKDLTDSINYAERIQRSFMATKFILDSNLSDYFVLFKPKDVVSGDFYWASSMINGRFTLLIADCTGHGVPGAIISIIIITAIEKAIEIGIVEPSDILNYTRNAIIERLKKDGSLEGGKDGMDASLISFDFSNSKFIYASANNPIWVIRNNELIELKPDKMPVGKHDKDTVSFTQNEFVFENGDVIYSITDGFPDQFGGPKGKKFMTKRFKELLISISCKSMPEQKQILEQTFKEWKGNIEQVDDVTVLGIRL